MNTIVIMLYGTFGYIIMSITTIVLFARYYRRNQLAQKELRDAEEKFKEQVVFASIKTLEDERIRFAQDLHDEIGASLSTIRLYTASLISKSVDADTKKQIELIRQTIDESMSSARRISHNLMPPGLELMGLPIVIEEYANNFIKSSHVKFEVTYNHSLRLPFEKELMLYRVIQELINNTLKYAQATQISISFDASATEYRIHYADNGIGFNINEHHITKGIGLQNIYHRLKMIDATYQLQSKPNEGMYIKILFPIIS